MTMRRTTTLLAVLSLLVLGVMAPAAAGPAERSSSPIETCNAPPPLTCAATDGVAVGTSTITRTTGGVSIVNHTTGLTSGDAVTNWFVVFNNPEACIVPGECSDADLVAFVGSLDPENPDAAQNPVGIDVLFATGHVVNGNRTSFAAHLAVGDTSGSLFGPFSVGLQDPFKAEVHSIVRTHGPAIPGIVNAQIRTVEGGCDPDTDEPCEDVQAAVHK